MNKIHESWKEYNRATSSDLTWMIVLCSVMALILASLIFAFATSEYVM